MTEAFILKKKVTIKGVYMAYGTAVNFEALRSVAAAGVLAAYSAVGTATTDHARLFSVFNSTDVDVIISLDGVTDHLRVASGSGQIFDLTANKVRDDGLFIRQGTIFYVKRAAAAPSSGDVWIEVMAAQGGV